ncbi:MAG: hypothetical protein ACM3KT_06625 [Deltaproteobacteria bacterium]
MTTPGRWTWPARRSHWTRYWATRPGRPSSNWKSGARCSA